jgi:hypothetical protein
MKLLGWHFFSWHICNSLVIEVSIISLFCLQISLNDSYFSYVLMGCRSNVLNFFQKFLTTLWLLMSCRLFKKSLYSFHMIVFIHILCNILSIKTVNSLVYWFQSFKICSFKNYPYNRQPFYVTTTWTNPNLLYFHRSLPQQMQMLVVVALHYKHMS